MENTIYDVIIIGACPAGLTASIYTSRARLNTLIIEGTSVTSQVLITNDVENYPGFPDIISGFDLVDKMKKQVSKFNVKFTSTTVKSISKRDSLFILDTDDGELKSKSVIAATGSNPKKLDVPGESKFTGRGVSYCATCDGAFFKDKKVFVVGGGDTAVEEAIFLTKFASKVSIVHRRHELRAAKIIQERVFENEKIEIVWDSVITEILGDKKVSGVKIKNVKTEKISEDVCDGVFIFVGYNPNTAFVKNLVKLDEGGHIVTDAKMKTSVVGMFACGDCRNTPLKQIITACGDGAIAGDSAQKYLEEIKK
ncbi:thioredoxin-disulfide reductase [bacterium]|nr:thioredoxin-disulfide reductase [bacterium]